MSLMAIVVTLIIVGVLLWLMETYIPMNDTIKKIIYAVVIIVIVLWLLQVFGVLDTAQSVKVQPIR